MGLDFLSIQEQSTLVELQSRPDHIETLFSRKVGRGGCCAARLVARSLVLLPLRKARCVAASSASRACPTLVAAPGLGQEAARAVCCGVASRRLANAPQQLAAMHARGLGEPGGNPADLLLAAAAAETPERNLLLQECRCVICNRQSEDPASHHKHLRTHDRVRYWQRTK